MNEHARLSNRHIVDQLAEIRETIRGLKKAETEIVKKVSRQMGDSDSLGGDQFIARQSVTIRKGSIDGKKLEADGIDVDSYRKPESTVFSIRVEPREVEPMQ